LCWNTNRHPNVVSAPTDGVLQQIDISLGQVGGIEPRHWAEFANVNDLRPAISNFWYFVFPNVPGNNNTNLVQQVPFTPARKISISARWEANDPLVRSLPEHLKDLTNSVYVRMVKPFVVAPLTNQTLGNVNAR